MSILILLVVSHAVFAVGGYLIGNKHPLNSLAESVDELLKKK